jgi:hypothetical protein
MCSLPCLILERPYEYLRFEKRGAFPESNARIIVSAGIIGDPFKFDGNLEGPRFGPLD